MSGPGGLVERYDGSQRVFFPCVFAATSEPMLRKIPGRYTVSLCELERQTFFNPMCRRSTQNDLPGDDVIPRVFLRKVAPEYAVKQGWLVAKWSQPKKTQGGLRLTCACNEHEACPLAYELTGTEEERSYKLTLRKSGDCSEKAKQARSNKKSKATSVQEIRFPDSKHRET